ncbi:MAG: MtnX-like HAD-IB family phosphatase [Candidatus Omnitrophica bacterium]|jgi:2,3-diketo-5-methylthio-1-phosphopentane phosphatase|nr:MtnX-like HAD-IB family phosphatase [Candidatus Omnitrophota bacterium]
MKKDAVDNFIVFFDFDNTITTIDVIDDILERFSDNDGWKALERKWQNEEIGSRECLKGQIEGVRVSRDKLDDYLSTVKIDPYFKKLLNLLESRKIPFLIVSDNFDYMLNGILKKNGISGVETYCNKVDFRDEWFVPSFPHSNAKCGDCANCKKTHILAKRRQGTKAIYVGDGRSDVCASKISDVVFAKGYLRKLFKEEGLPHVAIDSLKDVYEYFAGEITA